MGGVIHPRQKLFRAEIRYLEESGWISFCGTETPYLPPEMKREDGIYPFGTPMLSHEDAVAEQKRRDNNPLDKG